MDSKIISEYYGWKIRYSNEKYTASNPNDKNEILNMDSMFELTAEIYIRQMLRKGSN